MTQVGTLCLNNDLLNFCKLREFAFCDLRKKRDSSNLGSTFPSNFPGVALLIALCRLWLVKSRNWVSKPWNRSALHRSSTALRKGPCTWFGEVCYCCCLPALPGLAWVLLKYVLQRLFLISVFATTLSGCQERSPCRYPSGTSPSKLRRWQRSRVSPLMCWESTTTVSLSLRFTHFLLWKEGHFCESWRY